MSAPVITIKLPKHWRSTIILLITGGATFGISYWLWCRWRKLHYKNLADSFAKETSEGLNTFPVIGRKCGNRISTSIGSRTSTFNEKLSSISVHQRSPVKSMSVAPDSDLDDASSATIDCGRLGLRALADVVDHLENLMSTINSYEKKEQIDSSTNSGQLINDLRLLLEQAYQLREQYKRKIVLDENYVGDTQGNETMTDDDTCSYFSASEHIDLTELEYLISRNLRRPLYCAALQLLDTCDIPCRALRTQLLGCERDIEYLAKLHCLRQAFDYIFGQPEPTDWLCRVGKLFGFRLLHCLGYPTSDFNEAYERLIDYVKSEREKPTSTMAEELAAKGVRVVNFFDVVIDYMLIDSLELLANPPSSVLSVTRHRWLSDNFKRVALDSTIWTILLAKRKLLKYSDGFLAHYYNLTGTLAPALSWGFLGPDDGALRMCNRFRESLNAFLREAFVCYDKPGTHPVKQKSTPKCVQPDPCNPDSNRDKDVNYDQELADLERARRDDVQLDDSDGTNDVEDEDDNSTIICRSSSLLDTDSRSQVAKSHQNYGMRYTTIFELSEDLYNRFSDCIAQIAKMMNEEACVANNPMPDVLINNPPAPKLLKM